MSTVKISELPIIPILNSDTTQTLFPAVDVQTDITGRLTAKVLAATLYSNDVLNVGNTSVVLPNVVAQFASESDNYIQVNLQNSSGNGSSDYVITADTGDDSTYYIDMGYNGSTYNYDGYTYAKPLDGYLIVQGADNTSPGGNLVIGTTTAGKDISILVGSIDESKIMSKFVANTGFKMVQYPIYFADGTSQNTAASSAAHTELVFGKTNAAFSSANTIGSYANSAYAKANIVGSYANSAFAAANVAADSAVSGITAAAVADAKAVGAGSYANSAFSKANNALANTSGTFNGNLNITGNLSLLNGSLSSSGNMSVNGTMVLANSNFTPTESAITIKATASVATPSNDGYMLHISGKQNVPSRIVFDSYSETGNAYGLVAGRTARGNVDYPAPVQSGDVLMRISGNGYGTDQFAPLGIARIDIIATETYTNAARGSQIKFYNIENGSNTLVNIATFNANNVTFTGYVNPAKGFVYTPRVPAGLQTAITIDYTTDSMIKANCAADLAISHSNYVAGKVVEVWLVNTDNSNHTVTHGCAALRSTNKSTTATITAGSSMHLKFFSIDGDNANTFVSING